MLAVYNGIDEVIVIECDTNGKPNKKELKDFFGPGNDRDITDFDLKMNPKSVWIRSTLMTE